MLSLAPCLFFLFTDMELGFCRARIYGKMCLGIGWIG